jgi:ATP-dependent protease ClpP protease subunit
MKDMQREIKLLEKRKAKMEKIYEKSCGKAYKRQEMVDENE